MRRADRRWYRGVVLAAWMLAASHASAATPSRAQQACITKSHIGLRHVARVQRAEIARCLDDAALGNLPPGRLLAACVSADSRHRVATAVARAGRREATSCSPAPDFGWVAGAAPAQGTASALALAHAILGGDLDAAVTSDRRAARCQLLAVRRAGRCADRFLAEFAACAAKALRGGGDATALVHCEGADPEARIAEACRDELADDVGKRCVGQDQGAVFPGCAGKPLAACLAGHALASASRALNAAGGLCPVGPPPPAPEPIDLAVVPLPTGVTTAEMPWWTVDGSRIVLSVGLTGQAAEQIATIAPDGSEFRCLTCSLPVPAGASLLKPIPFPDGRRLLVRVGEQTPLSAAEHAILECAPSVLDCQSAVLVPVDPPAATDPAVVQDQRELRVAPDGLHVGLTQMRRSADGESTPTAILGVLERLADRYQVRDAHVVSTLGELKQFAHDQQSVIVVAFDRNPYGAANPDAVRVDLADGAVSRVTTHPDYDEPVEFSPDDQWFAVGSGRGGNFFSVFSQVPRPGLLNAGLDKVSTYFFVTQRGPLLEPWLVDRYGERGDYIGQQLNPNSLAEGYDGRMIMNWSPDGRQLVFSELRIDPSGLPPGAPDSRIVIATLSTRGPVTTVPPQPMPALDWAAPLAGFVPDPTPAASRSGAFSGTAEVSYTVGPTRSLAVVYTDFSDDGRAFLNGTEAVDYTPGLLGTMAYDADLRLSGCRQGFLVATDARLSGLTFTGSVQSEVDGKLLALP